MAGGGTPQASGLREGGRQDASNATYQFLGEDHTLGNALRYMLMKNPNVEFAGYTVPHPSEPFMNLRVQTIEGHVADEAVTQGLDSIIEVCNVVGKRYRNAVKQYKTDHPDKPSEKLTPRKAGKASK